VPNDAVELLRHPSGDLWVFADVVPRRPKSIPAAEPVYRRYCETNAEPTLARNRIGGVLPPARRAGRQRHGDERGKKRDDCALHH